MMKGRCLRDSTVGLARTVLLGVVLVLSGCAVRGPAPFPIDGRADAHISECARLFEDADAEAARAGVRDGGEARVDTFPYLRIDRFLASLLTDLAPPALPAWMERARRTDLRARGFELRNAAGAQDAARMARLDACGAHLMASDLATSARLGLLRKSVRVPDDYQTWKRIAGLYALARIPFASGVRGYQRKTARAFAMSLAQIRIEGRLRRYVVAQSASSTDGVPAAAVSADALPNDAVPELSVSETAMVADSATSAEAATDATTTVTAVSLKLDAAGIPDIDGATLDRLFARHAPAFEIDDTGAFDRPGALAWSGPRLGVDSARPTLYRRLTFTRYGTRVLPQLVYGVWFSARPGRGSFDLLGGHLDGVMWRVTLDESGRALVFDSIHPCGCYHQFFPTARARLKPAPDTLDEYAFVPQTLDDYREGQRVVLRVATRTHYLQRVLLEDAPSADSEGLRFADEDDLRSLARSASTVPTAMSGRHPPGVGYRSAFTPDGIVAGTERGERFLFWPMGVASPGAMRQYGRHATAFVGRRHFDDADLIERYFELEGN